MRQRPTDVRKTISCYIISELIHKPFIIQWMVHCWFISLTVHPVPLAPKSEYVTQLIVSAIIQLVLIQENC
jgi:hypothetical protein